MSTCVRGGIVYKRHDYVNEVCIHCEHPRKGGINGNQENHCEENRSQEVNKEELESCEEPAESVVV